MITWRLVLARSLRGRETPVRAENGIRLSVHAQRLDEAPIIRGPEGQLDLTG
jgi:hypothetical protein